MGRIDIYIMGTKFTKEEMNNMETMLNEFLKEHKIELEIPVDVFDIATRLGFDVRGAEFEDDLDGLILVNEHEEQIAPFSSNKVIAYNCRGNIHHKKFIVGHELAHYIEAKSDQQNQKVVYAARDHSEPYSDDINEQRKDYISAALLMPKNALLSQYEESQIEKTKEFYEEVSAKFKVSMEMTRRRIEEVFDV